MLLPTWPRIFGHLFGIYLPVRLDSNSFWKLLVRMQIFSTNLESAVDLLRSSYWTMYALFMLHRCHNVRWMTCRLKAQFHLHQRTDSWCLVWYIEYSQWLDFHLGCKRLAKQKRTMVCPIFQVNYSYVKACRTELWSSLQRHFSFASVLPT